MNAINSSHAAPHQYAGAEPPVIRGALLAVDDAAKLSPTCTPEDLLYPNHSVAYPPSLLRNGVNVRLFIPHRNVIPKYVFMAMSAGTFLYLGSGVPHTGTEPIRTDGTTMDSSELTIPQIGRVLWRNRIVILLCAVVGAAAGFLVARELPRTYTAQGLLVVEPRQISISELGAGTTGSSTDLIRTQTEAQVLRSRALTEAVVRDLDLASNPLFMKPDEESLFTPIRAALAAILPRGTAGPAPDRVSLAVDALEARLNVWAAEKSATIGVEVETEDPDLSATIANRVMQLYLTAQVDSKNAVTSHVNQALSGRLDALWQEVVEADRRVQRFREQNGLLETQGGDINAMALAELQSQLASVQGEVTNLRAAVRSTSRALETGGAEASAEVLASPLIQRLREQEAMVNRNLSNLSQRLGPRHPDILAQREELAYVRSQIALEIRKIGQSLVRDLTIAEARVEGLRGQIDDTRTRARDAATANVGLQQLVKEAEAKRAVYQAYMARAEQTAQNDAGPLPDVRIASAAVAPVKPSGPNRKAMTMFAGVAGLSLAAAGALLRDRVGGRVFSGSELARLTAFSAFGTVPQVRITRAVRHLGDAVVKQPHQEAAESVRGLWAGLRAARLGWAPKVVVVTSSEPGEGKTSLVAALGRVAALDGARVLVIDGDFRMPTIGSFLDAEDGEVVDELLATGKPPELALRGDAASGLMYLPAGGRLPNPQAVLGGEAMGRLLQDARANFDLVLIDSPPIMRVSDPIMLVRQADAVLFVAAWGGTRRSVAAEAARRLKVPDHVLAASVLGRVVGKDTAREYYAGYRRKLPMALPAPHPANTRDFNGPARSSG